MSFTVILQAFGFGFLIAMAIGPIGLLCISRTLTAGFPAGLTSGLGVALADGTYAAIVALGAAAFAATLTAYAIPLQIAGGLLLALLGLKTCLDAAKESRAAEAPSRSALVSAGLSAYALTMTNPATVAAFTAVATAVGLDSIAVNYQTAILFTVGLFLGSFAWYAILTGGVAIARHRLPRSFIIWLNRVAGGLLLIAGLYLAGLGASLF